MPSRPAKRRSEQPSVASFFAKRQRSEEAALCSQPAETTLVSSGPVAVGDGQYGLSTSKQIKSGHGSTKGIVSRHSELVMDGLAGLSCSDENKLFLISNRQPEVTTEIPATFVVDRRKSFSFFKAILQKPTFDKHDWLGYYDANGDLEEAGVFCVACVLFPTKH